MEPSLKRWVLASHAGQVGAIDDASIIKFNPAVGSNQVKVDLTAIRHDVEQLAVTAEADVQSWMSLIDVRIHRNEPLDPDVCPEAEFSYPAEVFVL